jgi:hypothetical protein
MAKVLQRCRLHPLQLRPQTTSHVDRLHYSTNSMDVGRLTHHLDLCPHLRIGRDSLFRISKATAFFRPLRELERLNKGERWIGSRVSTSSLRLSTRSLPAVRIDGVFRTGDQAGTTSLIRQLCMPPLDWFVWWFQGGNLWPCISSGREVDRYFCKPGTTSSIGLHALASALTDWYSRALGLGSFPSFLIYEITGCLPWWLVFDMTFDSLTEYDWY